MKASRAWPPPCAAPPRCLKPLYAAPPRCVSKLAIERLRVSLSVALGGGPLELLILFILALSIEFKFDEC